MKWVKNELRTFCELICELFARHFIWDVDEALFIFVSEASNKPICLI